LSYPGNPPAPDCVDAEMNQDKPLAIVCVSFHQSATAEVDSFEYPSPNVISTRTYVDSTDWSADTGGSSISTMCYNGPSSETGAWSPYYQITQSQWDNL
jgi:hypothetical protein